MSLRSVIEVLRLKLNVLTMLEIYHIMKLRKVKVNFNQFGAVKVSEPISCKNNSYA